MRSSSTDVQRDTRRSWSWEQNMMTGPGQTRAVGGYVALHSTLLYLLLLLQYAGWIDDGTVEVDKWCCCVRVMWLGMAIKAQDIPGCWTLPLVPWARRQTRWGWVGLCGEGRHFRGTCHGWCNRTLLCLPLMQLKLVITHSDDLFEVMLSHRYVNIWIALIKISKFNKHINLSLSFVICLASLKLSPAEWMKTDVWKEDIYSCLTSLWWQVCDGKFVLQTKTHSDFLLTL